MKKLVLAAICLLMSATLSAQDSILPLDYQTTPADQYYKFEQNVIDCADWFINTPLNQPGTELPRDMIAEFLGTWIDASPTMYLELNENIMYFCGQSPDLTMAYIIGYTSTLLNIKKEVGTLNTSAEIGHSREEQIAGSIGGIEQAGKFYEVNRENLGRNRNLERFLKMQKEGTLEALVESYIK